ncbi:MAG: gamma-glutamylcyclotransferase [Labedaea sp.]
MRDLLFVYGTLQPGASAWHLLRPWTTGPPRPAVLPGALYDTGLGYPALDLNRAGEGDGGPEGGVGVTGWVVELRAPSATALTVLDSYEGSEYQRVLVALPDGVVCWTYVWIAGFDGMRRLSTPWPARTDEMRRPCAEGSG